ncbi:Copper amine oxidase N-terminal domain-containing protein [Paenibacillus sp. 1_12]|uniref:stalk domain-containing protein n=1 Tax=Paenibacillus sp. 1_12 TaxID=1566278 RepID=UPI0008F04168|nr:stalk domain-containing protein [Paenibacillus sp. 1_12]SFK76196.1 Copper amine oxidase N-terminal domain-containing protein [Paenibacillus sp. 1_12]
MIKKTLKTLVICSIMFVSLLFISNPSIFAEGETELPVFNTLKGYGVSKVKMSPDGSMLLATGSAFDTYLWNVNSGISKKINIPPHTRTENVNDATFSPDGTMFALSAGYESYGIHLFDSKSGELKNTIKLKDPYIGALSFTSDSKSIIAQVSDGNRSIKTINITTSAELLKLDVTSNASRISHHPQNDEFAVLLSDSQSIVQIRNENTGAIIKTLNDFTAGFLFSDMGFSQDGNYFVVSHNGGKNSETIVFNAKDGYKQIAVIKESGNISFSKDGKLLILGDMVYTVEEGFTHFYRIKVKNSKETINPYVSGITPDGKYAFYVDNVDARDRKIRLLDASALSIRLSSIQIDPKGFALNVNDHTKLMLEGTYSDGTKKSLDTSKVKWSIQDFYVAEVKDSILYGRSNGNTILTANFGDLTTNAQVVIADAPTDLKAALNGNSINLTWSGVKNKNDLLGYYVYRKTGNGSYNNTPLTDFPLQTTEYADLNIDAKQGNFYIIKAVYKNKIESIPSNEAFVTSKAKQIILQVNNHMMKINGESKEIDAGNGTTPIIHNGKTLLPIRALIDELGGKLDWLDGEQKITIQLNNNKIDLWIDKNTAYVNGTAQTLDVAPAIISGRTMLPLRFIGENLGLQLEWDGATQTINLSYGGTASASIDISKKWYELEYTRPVSNTFGEYIDSGFGFTINYPLAWGKPKITESKEHNFGFYTTYYKSDNTVIISYGEFLQDGESNVAYVKRNGFDISNIVAEEKIQYSEKVYYLKEDSGNKKKIAIMIFKHGEVCVFENTIYDVNLIQNDQKAIDLFVEILTTLKLTSAAVG